MTDVLRLDPDRPDAQLVMRAADRLRAGELVAFPTETVYGLGAHALDDDAVRRLFAAKRRPAYDPLIVHVASVDDLPPLVASLPAAVAGLATRFWPGPLTLILPRSERVPLAVTAGLAGVAVRVPSHPIAHALLIAAAIPVVAPSANLFSRPSPTTAAHVLDDLDGRIDLVIDGGATTVGLESTVVDLSTPAPVVLRHGATSIARLRDLLPDLTIHTTTQMPGTPLPGPGLIPRHYAPAAPLTLYVGASADCMARIRENALATVSKGERLGILVPTGDVSHLADLGATVVDLGPEGDLDRIAARLYAALRELDHARLDRIFARDVTGTDGLAPAIHDRLRRAADGRVIQC
jgi:L-threonylcarbamoyladenylate synthase